MVDNEARVIQPQDDPPGKAQRALWFLGMAASFVWLAFELKSYFWSESRQHWYGAIVISLSLALACALKGFGYPLSYVFQLAFGRIKYIQIDSVDLDRRIRKRYQSQINEIEMNGFVRLFYLGEAFRVAHLFLILPAIVFIMMWLNGELLLLRNGRIVVAYPVFASDDGSTLAYIFGLGTKFYTAFRDGTLVVNKSFKDRLPDSRELIKHGGKRNISAAWIDHQKEVRGMESVGRAVDRQTGFDFFVSLIERG